MRYFFSANNVVFSQWYHWFISAVYFAILKRYRLFIEMQKFDLNCWENNEFTNYSSFSGENVLDCYCNAWVNLKFYALENQKTASKLFNSKNLSYISTYQIAPLFQRSLS